VVSPWAKKNYVDHALTDQTSIIRFIEDNWLHGQRIGGGSFDVLAGSIEGMFDFRSGRPRNTERIFLSPATGEIQHVGGQSDSAFYTEPFADQKGYVDTKKRR
jgi:phospholipase C